MSMIYIYTYIYIFFAEQKGEKIVMKEMTTSKLYVYAMN